MEKKTNGSENRFTRFIKTRRKWVTALVILAVIIAGATFWVLRYNGEAATYKKRILECTAMPGMVSHIHNDDCYQDGMLVCPLPEIEPHEHTDACYLAALSCTIPESDGHQHTDACYYTERQLICDQEESEEHQHSNECYAEVNLLVCGMEEGEGAHHHTDACYESVLICDKPVLPLHIHGAECIRIEEMTIDEIEGGDENETDILTVDTEEMAEGADSADAAEKIDETAANQNDMSQNSGEEAQADQNPEEAEGSASDATPELNPSADGTDADTSSDAAQDAAETQDSGSIPEDGENQDTGEGGTDCAVSDPDQETAEERESEKKESGESETDSLKDQIFTAQAVKDGKTGAISYTVQAVDILVSVEADEGAFPDGTEMRVSPVYDEGVLGDLADAVEGNVLHVQAVDISFWHEGVEIEPAKPIRVTMTPAEMPGTGSSRQEVIHINNEGGADVVAQEESTESEVVFETDSFSVYAIVYIEIEKNVIASDGETYHISVSYGPEAGIPEGAELGVTEVLPDSEEYRAYVQMADDTIADEMVSFARFFDITILANGREVQPLAPVEVKIELADDLDDTAKAIHFGEDIEVLNEAVVSQAESAENADALINEVSFSTEGFSVYGVVLTTLKKTIEASDGNTYQISVTYGADAKIPLDAVLSVKEILEKLEAADGATEYETYIAKAQDALGLETGVFPYIRVFDITIQNENGEKIIISAPVNVRIELADKEAGQDAEVIHFADGAETGEIISGVEQSGNTVSFEAEGFSAYAIVTGPPAVPVGWHTVASISELLDEHANTGVYIGNQSGFYYGNTTTGDSKRTGITKTKPAENYPGKQAALYYFEQVEDSENQVYAYCYAKDGTTKQYVYNGNNNSLSFTTEENKTAFTLTQKGNGIFTLNNGSWYWNMQGGASGTRFCSYNSENDPNNNVNFWYFTEAESDPYSMDEKTYGLMFWDESLYGKALMASTGSANTLHAKPLMVLATADNKEQLFVPNDSDISMWTFSWIRNDYYNLTATVNGSTKYLKIDTKGLSLVDDEADASSVQVVPGTGTHAGQIGLKSGEATLTYSGSADTGFSVGGSAGTEWLNLVDLSELTSDYYKTYSASKVGVSDESITTGSKVIVYTRAWNEETLKYEYYAVDHDGTLVRCYESGDSIEWVGNVINTMLWQFTEYQNEDGTPSYFYELYNEYAEKYLAPQLTGDQIVSDETIGINMNGRRSGRYYSPIVAWDEANYSYAGLKVVDGQIVSCPLSEAMDFYFAVMEDVSVDDSLTMVKTVDHTQSGITMKLIDYNSTLIKGDGTTSTTEQHAVMGTSVFTQWNEQPGLLSTSLGESGYPTVIGTGKSLYELFGNASEVNHLFIESTYNATGYYEFDSAQNFASLKGATSGNFTVYKELGTYDGSTKTTLKHGQFLPFNDIEAGRFASVNRQNLYSATGPELPKGDPRKYENLYLVNGKEDLYFGVELEASFTQTPNGLDDWGHDIIFEFTGDDDFWLYVDGELVIDLGGIHSALPGSVNFRTGAVNVNGKATTLRALFEQNYRTRNQGATDAEVAAYLAQYFDEGSTIFRDYSSHTMHIFYMERGGGASNLHMRFNLASVKQGTVELSKSLSGIDSTESTLAEFAYQITYKKKNDSKEYYLENSTAGSSQPENYVFYKDTAIPVTYKESLTIGGVSYNNVFILKPDEKVVINFPTFGPDKEEIESYSVVECGVNTVIYKSVMANGVLLDGTSSETGIETRKDYRIEYASTGDRQRVNYVNEIDPEAMRTLTFSKKLFDADGETQITKDSTAFNFRLYFGTESDPELSPANMYKYHVKDADGYYCGWDAAAQRFVKIGAGITDYGSLTEQQKAAASFSTSMNGSISKIPVDHTVEVRQILAGTKYMIQERPEEIPDGYSFQKYVYYEDYDPTNPIPTESYSGGDSAATAGAPDGNDHNGTVYNVIATGKDPHVDICNLKGWGLRMNKVWTDADYMSGRDDTYFAVFTKDSTGALTPVKDSLRKLPYELTTLYWYWLKLPVSEVAFEDYAIREVKILDGKPQFDENGVSVNQMDLKIEPIDDGGELKLNGTQKSETEHAEFTYTVRYNKGELSTESNVRVDTVTNDRPGIILKKQDWSGNPLSGATFTMTEENSRTLIGTFTSDSEGNITTAFLGEGKNYKLTETSAPQGYHGLEATITICASDGVLNVSGPDEQYYSLEQASGTNPAVLTIKNRPSTFQAIKQDGDTAVRLEGVHFELHQQVTVDGITVFDNSPLKGYEDLITGEDGVIPGIDNTLSAGTYQLREKEPLEGYKPLPGYIEFNVSKTGTVSLLPSMKGEKWLEETSEIYDTGELAYTLTIRNYIDASLIVKKVNETNQPLTGAKFELWKYGNTTWEAVSEYSEIDMADKSEIKLEGLSVGRYRLDETQAPTGYVIRTKSVYFKIDQDGHVSLTDEEGTGDNANDSASLNGAGDAVIIKNHAGLELPHTGGVGTHVLTLLGGLMTTLAGALLLKRKYI